MLTHLKLNLQASAGVVRSPGVCHIPILVHSLSHRCDGSRKLWSPRHVFFRPASFVFLSFFHSFPEK
ncbi:MAG: hypothetical protein BJ554DRAFT_7942 [Olpidium bornovanus]|uniref:Uncharacterized protein n=1 Tax=Olpidium bornovanus TaxID=278681 RepID=A0A8H8DJ22_9FUNG|nr:MAG: hypothetical protein BJ554DRAFT_7942 [Olpidium bornovanus]